MDDPQDGHVAIGETAEGDFENEALSLLRSRFEGRPVIEAEEVPPNLPKSSPLATATAHRANIWWIKLKNGLPQTFYVRFMDAHVLTLPEKKLPFLYIERRPRALYKQTNDEQACCGAGDFFFKRVHQLDN